VLHPSCTVSQTSETIDHRSSLSPNPRVRSAFGLVSSAGEMPHDNSAGSEGFPKPTSNAMARRPQNRTSFKSRPNFGQEQPSIPPIVSPHPFRPPLIPEFRVSEQPYKSHSVLSQSWGSHSKTPPTTHAERASPAKRLNASALRQARRTRGAPREEPRRPRRRPARSARSTSPTPSDQTLYINSHISAGSEHTML